MPVDEVAADYSNYGAAEGALRAEVERVFGERALIVRPGLIVGPHDPTGRFTYWARRLARGGEILAPGPPSGGCSSSTSATSPAWIVDAAERRADRHLQRDERGRALGRAARRRRRDLGLGRVPAASTSVGEWMELPLWLGDAWGGPPGPGPGVFPASGAPRRRRPGGGGPPPPGGGGPPPRRGLAWQPRGSSRRITVRVGSSRSAARSSVSSWKGTMSTTGMPRRLAVNVAGSAAALRRSSDAPGRRSVAPSPSSTKQRTLPVDRRRAAPAGVLWVACASGADVTPSASPTSRSGRPVAPAPSTTSRARSRDVDSRSLRPPTGVR